MRFIGCKDNLLQDIETFVSSHGIRGNSFCDLFSGTGSVGKHFKKLGYKIISTDLLFFSYVLQKVYIELNRYPQFDKLIKNLGLSPEKETLFTYESVNAEEIIRYLNDLPPIKGFIYKNYSPEGTAQSKYIRKYFTGQNATKIDAVRQKVEEWKRQGLIDDDEYYFLVCAVIEAVPFVANISGTYAAFLKKWDPRAHKTFMLEVPKIIESNQKHIVHNINGLNLLDEVKNIDILYLDPPYNERQYAPNYHILETIALWDNPKIKGVTGMREY